MFTNDIAWVAYEGIQADIFDHLFAIIPHFGLRVFQQPSGADVAELGNLLSGAEPGTRPGPFPRSESAQAANGGATVRS